MNLMNKNNNMIFNKWNHEIQFFLFSIFTFLNMNIEERVVKKMRGWKK